MQCLTKHLRLLLSRLSSIKNLRLQSAQWTQRDRDQAPRRLASVFPVRLHRCFNPNFLTAFLALLRLTLLLCGAVAHLRARVTGMSLCDFASSAG